MWDEVWRTPCPEWLEDEALMIETSGEMPEVALHESISLLPELGPKDLECLRQAVARCYLRLLRRDLDYANLGQPPFRGLERAWQNLARLRNYLARLGWPEPPGLAGELAASLRAYLAAELEALKAGRGYASAELPVARGLLGELGQDPGPWQGLLETMAALPAPDFRGLLALRRLTAPPEARVKLRRRQGKALVIASRQSPEGPDLAVASLPLAGPAGGDDPEALARAQLVWELLPLAPVR